MGIKARGQKLDLTEDIYFSSHNFYIWRMISRGMDLFIQASYKNEMFLTNYPIPHFVFRKKVTESPEYLEMRHELLASL